MKAQVSARAGAKLAAAGLLALLGGCAGLPHGNLGMPATGGVSFDGTAFNGKDYADPHPTSASDAQQRAAYQAHQQQQIDAAKASAVPDLSHMTCSGTSTASSGVNAGTLTSSTNCHN
ncbi:hypothetical protein [Acidisphaera rubrifaciens]|uniref:Lipoprotein n=1 Tax=Acidisphaera rubrifaciens HS-AP3 TaxID=1231350 RepID=A0A0D6P7H7_9PROT|nr:hypothetical protein [Acidisphaera rubrifaciens]GAN77715.1 hypothetical protein Asru_0427_03 [Acidisphaera rubrifaciens HS-AP3]